MRGSWLKSWLRNCKTARMTGAHCAVYEALRMRSTAIHAADSWNGARVHASTCVLQILLQPGFCSSKLFSLLRFIPQSTHRGSLAYCYVGEGNDLGRRSRRVLWLPRDLLTVDSESTQRQHTERYCTVGKLVVWALGRRRLDLRKSHPTYRERLQTRTAGGKIVLGPGGCSGVHASKLLPRSTVLRRAPAAESRIKRCEDAMRRAANS